VFARGRDGLSNSGNLDGGHAIILITDSGFVKSYRNHMRGQGKSGFIVIMCAVGGTILPPTWGAKPKCQVV
jgi:hypothetical protein